MEATKYLLSLTGAAILSAVTTTLLGEKGTLGKVVKLLCGIFMCLTILAPICRIRLDAFSDMRTELTIEAEQIAQSGQNAARDAMANGIIAAAQTYILDKAEMLGAEVTVEVMLDDSSIPVPCGVRIRGNVSPYLREQLGSIIQRDLGIPTEAQIWT